MGIECPACGSTNTKAMAPNKMLCNECAHHWKPYKHIGKPMRTVGDGIVYPRRRIMPGAKTEVVGSKMLGTERRVKKTRRKRSFFGL